MLCKTFISFALVSSVIIVVSTKLFPIDMCNHRLHQLQFNSFIRTLTHWLQRRFRDWQYSPWDDRKNNNLLHFVYMTPDLTKSASILWLDLAIIACYFPFGCCIYPVFLRSWNPSSLSWYFFSGRNVLWNEWFNWDMESSETMTLTIMNAIAEIA